jgi:hypothetical protein
MTFPDRCCSRNEIARGHLGNGQRPAKACASASRRSRETLVFDLASKTIVKGGRRSHTLDAEGKVLASNNNFGGTGDPFIASTVPRDGRYIVVSDTQFAEFPARHLRRCRSSPAVIRPSRLITSEVELVGSICPLNARLS